ncbi:FAD-dependent oxidoreductase [Ulvibacterium sp.]|uniref:flavin monoamine oxidase family protein n=1 Tax=Ulvibacterium sp. TaxID=2665914 RepID=UPI0026125B2D|nr:FAD-dependent oxidoreductase [Ulvibacterium sp.]
MTRNEFVQLCGILGVGLPIQAAFGSCSKDEPILEASDTVIIIGAGAAGLSAAYLLRQRRVDVQILEAASHYGGRMIRTTDFADFPIPLGAEWLHVERGVFDEIVNDPSTTVSIHTTPYDPNMDYGVFEGRRVSVADIGFTIDQKFVNATWYDFFEAYITPFVRDRISYGQIVKTIDYSGEQVIVQTTNGEFSANRVIVTVPVKMLQKGTIAFIPELPSEKQDAINNVTVWDGCKAFIEFSEKFYPTFIGFDITPETDGQKLYYDAAYGQNTAQNILGLFAVGTGTLPYVNLSDDNLLDYMLTELDALFDGQASANYVKHLFQNWNEAPFANGAYLVDHEDWRRVRTLGESVGNQLFFAGDAYTTGEDWSSVHAAARSAKRVVEALLG